MTISTAKTVTDTPALPEDVEAAIVELDREMLERKRRMRQEAAAKKHDAYLKSVSAPLSEVHQSFRRTIRTRVHRAERHVYVGRLDSVRMDIRPSEREMYHLAEAHAMIMDEIRTGTFMDMPACDLGGGRFLIVTRRVSGLPKQVDPVEGMTESEVCKMWLHVTCRPGCFTISPRHGSAVTDWQLASKTIGKIAKAGLLDAFDADGLLLVSPGRLLR